ncbi:hypothetical protein Elgi_49760 [Paenibacillus elgii]|nr:hypothetical protein Elgi_49760 [Paenibacillus elgii]
MIIKVKFWIKSPRLETLSLFNRRMIPGGNDNMLNNEQGEVILFDLELEPYFILMMIPVLHIK